MLRDKKNIKRYSFINNTLQNVQILHFFKGLWTQVLDPGLWTLDTGQLLTGSEQDQNPVSGSA